MNISEIDREIEILERTASNFSDCEKLSVFYNIRNNMIGRKEPVPEYSYASAPSSEFVSILMKKPIDKVLEVFEEHMAAIEIMCPKEYSAVMDKLNSI